MIKESIQEEDITLVNIYAPNKGTFHAKIGSIKNRNGMDLTKAEDIQKRWKNTQKICTKKILMTQLTMMV